VERFNRTMLEEWAYGQLYRSGLPRVELTPCLRGRGPCWKDQQYADPIST
jgi:hypothetical protein